MTLNPNLFGENFSQGPETKEIAALVKKYPAVLDNRGIFFWFCIKGRCPFLAQLIGASGSGLH